MRFMGKCLLCLPLAVSFTGTQAAQANTLESWLDDSATCLASLAGFNENRPWLQLTIAGDRVTVIVESGGRENVAVTLSCIRGGDAIAEGATYTVPEEISGGIDLPEERLQRNAFDRAGLATLVERGSGLAGVPEQIPLSLVVTSLSLPDPVVQTTLSFERPAFSTVTFDPEGQEIEDRAPPDTSWVAPMAEFKPTLSIEAPIRSSAKVMQFLRGALGNKTVVHRLVVDTGQVTVAYDDASNGYFMRQWSVDEGILVGRDPATPIDKQMGDLDTRCSRPATVDQLPTAFEKLSKKIGTRLDGAMMLILDCRADGGKTLQWELLGGDGQLVEGQPLLQEKFRFQP